MTGLGFYRAVQRLCIERGIRITALAGEIGLSKGAPSTWLRGSVPSSDTVRRISKFFDVDEECLHEERDIPGVAEYSVILTRIRTKTGWSQTELAKKLETTYATISRIENGGQSPSFGLRHRINALAEENGVSPDRAETPAPAPRETVLKITLCEDTRNLLDRLVTALENKTITHKGEVKP